MASQNSLHGLTLPPLWKPLQDPTLLSLLVGQASLSLTIPTTHIYPISVNNKSLIILWPAANRWRIKHGLPHCAFSIPLPEGSLDTATPWPCIAGIPVPPWAGIDALDALVVDHRMRAINEKEVVRALVERFPGEERAWVRLGEWARERRWWKGVQCSFLAAMARGGAEAGRGRVYEKLIHQAGEETEWGVWTEGERKELEGFGSKVVSREFLQLQQCVGGRGRSVETRVAQYVPTLLGRWWKLPRFFSWVIPARLAGMSTPRSRGDVDALRSLGIEQVVTLTAEAPLPREWFGVGIKNTFVPVQNLFPPTVQQMDRILKIMLEEPTLVHCGGGKGRAGTALACYVALFGFNPPDAVEDNAPPAMEGKKAVEALRHMRPGSLETEHQEKFVENYVSLAWKRYGQGEPLYGDGGAVNEPVGLPLEITGNINEPDVVMLVGLQGSGKSTFCNMAKLRNPNVIVISPDTVVAEGDGAIGAGSAARACMDVIGRFKRSPEGHKSRRVLIIDRCNPTVEERKYWSSLATVERKIAIFFEYDPNICRARVENRSFHPTMPPWRAKNAIESVAKMMVPPTMKEPFHGIVKIRGIDNTRELADRLFGPVSMQKFIRTRHLLDLGSATRDDLVVPPQDLTRYLSQHVIVEEKIDGANLGISISASGDLQVQNRSHYVSANDQAQFSLLPKWLGENDDALREILRAEEDGLPERYILYGEWMVAVHSIEYTHLPGWFCAFDMYDRLKQRFFSRSELTARLNGMIPQVPVLYEGVLENEEMLLGFLDTKSQFSPEVRVEGIIVRFQGGERGKVVRGDFIAGSRHWSKNELRRNRIWRQDM